MWPKVWKIVFALFAFLGALVFLLICTLVIVVFVETQGRRSPGHAEPAENLQYLLVGCGLDKAKILAIDKRHATSYDGSDNDDSDVGYTVNAYALKLAGIDTREFPIAGADDEAGWHRLRQNPLPYLSRSALQLYFSYVNTSKSPNWLPNETQLMSNNYYLRVNQLSFDNGRATSASICIFRPTDTKLHVLTVNHW